MTDPSLLLAAAAFAADHHREQRRSGYDVVPYINHPLQVARCLAEEAGETDAVLLVAALLHDTVEDTDATAGDLRERFGEKVMQIVLEVTDDMTLPYAERKARQVRHAAALSPNAQKLKIADKLCNIRDMMRYPVDWPAERKRAYLDWSEQVVDQVRGVHPVLEALFDAEVMRSRAALTHAPHVDPNADATRED